MLDFLTFAASVIVISASGVMSPGPLFASTISISAKQKLAGFKIALGHTVVEMPLILLISLGTISLNSFPQFRFWITIFGAVSIFAFSGIQIISLKGVARKDIKYGSFLTGVLFTGFNPFFLIWWFTIGMKLITDAMSAWAFWGIPILFGLHIWMDYAWLGFVSITASKSAKLLSSKQYKIFMIGINVMMIYFGISFISGVLTTP